MARFMVKASEFKNVCKAVNDRKLAELKKEIIEILKKQDEKDVKKAIDYFNSQEGHYTHLEKSLISGKWIQKAGYGVGTVRIWKGKKYKKIAPGKWARVFDKEGRGTNIAIGKLIARVQKIDNVEDLMAFVMQNKQRFVDENGIDLPVLDKLRAAVDARNGGEIGSVSKQKTEKSKYEKLLKEFKSEVTNEKKRPTRELESDIKEWKDYIEHKDFGEEKTNYLKELVKVGESELERRKGTSKPAESTTTAELINKNKDKIDKYGIDIYKDEISNTTPKALKNMDEKELKDFINFTEYLKNENEKIHDNAQNQNEKNKAWMSAAHSEQLNRMAKNRLKAVIAQNEPIKNFNTEVANSVDIENFKKELDDSYNSEFRVASRLSEGDTDYSEGAIKFDKLVKNDKGAKEFIEKISNTNVGEIDSSLYKTVVMDLLEKEGFFKESEAEKKDDLEKYNKEMNERRAERQSAEYKEIVDKIPFESDSNKKIFLTGIKAMNISNDMKLDIADWFAKNKINGRSYADYLIEKVKEGYDKYESSSKGKGVSGKGALYKGNTGIPCDNKAAAYFAQFLAMAKDRGMEELKESEAEKTQNRSEAMKGNKNAYKGISELEKMSPDSLQEYVDEMHNKIMKMDHEDKGLHDAIETWKNAERIRKEKLHAAHELRSDFETKLLNRLQDGIEKQKEACENWNIAEMSDNQLSEYIKAADKWKDKGLVHLADPIIDKWVDSGKDTYDNNDFVGPAMDYQGFAIAHSKAYDKMKKELESRKKAKDEENKPEKTVEETKETPKEEKTEKIYSVDNSGKVVSFDELQPIASNKSVGENEVQLPYSKDLANEIESLKNCVVPKWDNREFMKHVYYENGKLITTDARRMKFIEVGDLEGIPNGSYVDINTDKSGINIKKIDVDARFPNYSKVIPEDLKQTATLDTKLVKNKIKEMQKDGAISKKGTNLVQLEFRDGKIFIDDTAVGEAKDIKMKYGDGWGPAREDTNFIAFNADYLVNALSGKTSVLQIGERADKAMAINTGSSSNILMPMFGSNTKMDYGKGRQEKNDANEKKAALKEAYKNTNVEFINSIKEKKGDRFKKVSEMAANDLENRMSAMDDETLKLNYDRLRFNLDKVLDKKEYITEDTKVDNKLKLSLRDAILYQTMAKEHPEVIKKFEEELERRGITVKKSLFDDFVMDMFIDEDEEEIEEDEEDESLFNDYSAEQPELFNSTEMKVQEAFNRCGCCL